MVMKPAIAPAPVKKQRTIRKRIVEAPKPVEKGKVELSDGFCQTEVNDDGLWQKQDGWIVNVDEDVLARALWRRAMRYVGCPSCKGAGDFLKNVVEVRSERQAKTLRISRRLSTVVANTVLTT